MCNAKDCKRKYPNRTIGILVIGLILVDMVVMFFGDYSFTYKICSDALSVLIIMLTYHFMIRKPKKTS